MKKNLSLAMIVLLILTLVPAMAEETEIRGQVVEIEKYGHALLDITIEDFNSAGFTLGDIVTVKFGDFEKDMPLLNGYYVDPGEYQVIAHPMRTYIELCINNKNFAETTGIRAGDTVTLTMHGMTAEAIETLKAKLK